MKAQRVAFVCLHSSTKCLIAAEYFNRLAAARGLSVRATTSGPEPDPRVPANVVDGMKRRGADVQACRPALIAADQPKDADLIVSVACDAGRKLMPGKTQERRDKCPAVSDAFDIGWDFITGCVETLVGRIAAT
jgi:protein-tyrosine-phosphatase